MRCLIRQWTLNLNECHPVSIAERCPTSSYDARNEASVTTFPRLALTSVNVNLLGRVYTPLNACKALARPTEGSRYPNRRLCIDSNTCFSHCPSLLRRTRSLSGSTIIFVASRSTQINNRPLGFCCRLTTIPSRAVLCPIEGRVS